MYVYVQCSGCQGTLRVGASHRGKRVRCPRCRGVSPIPFTPSNSGRNANLNEPFDSATQTADWASDDLDSELDIALDHLPDDHEHPHPLGFRLHVDDAQCVAQLVVERGDGVLTNTISVDNELTRRGVSYGVSKDAIRIAIMSLAYPEDLEIGRRFEVATGKPARPGQDGKIAYQVNVSGEKVVAQRDDEHDESRVDHKDTGAITMVKTGDVLAVIHPPIAGDDGIGLDGQPIKPPKSEAVSLDIGEGTELSADGHTLLATRDGRPVLLGTILSVHEIYEIEHDVDLTTGNVTFDGHVVVKGNVLDEFEIRCKSLEVHGSVGAAKLFCAGDAELKGGVNGNRKGRLVIGGLCIAKYLNEAHVQTGGDLVVERGVTNSVIHSQAAVIAERIVGGRAIALHGFEVNYLGSDLGVVTTVQPGIHYETAKAEETLDALSQELDSFDSNSSDGRTIQESNERVIPSTKDPSETPLDNVVTADECPEGSQPSHFELSRREQLVSSVERSKVHLMDLRRREADEGIAVVNVKTECNADVLIQIAGLSMELTQKASGQSSIAINPETKRIEVGKYRRRKFPDGRKA